jgi:hypothetical protein
METTIKGSHPSFQISSEKFLVLIASQSTVHMHLPTINHIDLSFIQDFPSSSFTPSVNLHRFQVDILYLRCFDRSEEDGFPEIVVQSDVTRMSQIREFHTTGSDLVTIRTKLLRAKKQDGQPTFNFTDLRRLSICLEDDWNIRYLLQSAKLLEKLYLSVGPGRNLVGLHDILSQLHAL